MRRWAASSMTAGRAGDRGGGERARPPAHWARLRRGVSAVDAGLVTQFGWSVRRRDLSHSVRIYGRLDAHTNRLEAPGASVKGRIGFSGPPSGLGTCPRRDVRSSSSEMHAPGRGGLVVLHGRRRDGAPDVSLPPPRQPRDQVRRARQCAMDAPGGEWGCANARGRVRGRARRLVDSVGMRC